MKPRFRLSGLSTMRVAVPRILASGDAAMTVEFADKIDAFANLAVLSLDRAIAREAIVGILETVPTYRSLLVHYDPVVVGFNVLSGKILELAKKPTDQAIAARRWRIPVVYGGAFGIDLDDVAKAHQITTDEVIARHAASNYRVAMIGFTPGFAYLSGLNPSIATPRRQNPRTVTPTGTISVGGAQACVQCLAGPSGWHLLGRTPVRSFQPNREPVFLLEPGDQINFYKIAAKEFDAMDRAAERGDTVAELIAS